jgi:hypothetical protein
MKALVILGAVSAVVVGLASTAEAGPLRKNETYCLDTPMGGGGRGGGTYIDCRFETLQQCYETRIGIGGTCMLNPRLAFSERGRASRYNR